MGLTHRPAADTNPRSSDTICVAIAVTTAAAFLVVRAQPDGRFKRTIRCCSAGNAPYAGIGARDCVPACWGSAIRKAAANAPVASADRR